MTTDTLSCIIILVAHRGVEQLAARWAHNPKVGGSSPPPATQADDPFGSSAFFDIRPYAAAFLTDYRHAWLSRTRTLFSLHFSNKCGGRPPRPTPAETVESCESFRQGRLSRPSCSKSIKGSPGPVLVTRPVRESHSDEAGVTMRTRNRACDKESRNSTGSRTGSDPRPDTDKPRTKKIPLEERNCTHFAVVFRKHQKQTVMEKNNTCTPCEQNFRDEVDHLVDEVKGYTKKDHEQKKKEVDEAFGKRKEQESGR